MESAKVKMKQGIDPGFSFVLLLGFHVVQAVLCGLQKKMLANISGHLLAEKRKCLLVHSVVGAPVNERREIVF